MDLEELVGEISSKVELNANLKAKEQTTRNDVLNLCQQNYDEVCKNEISKLNEIWYSVRTATRREIYKSDFCSDIQPETKFYIGYGCIKFLYRFASGGINWLDGVEKMFSYARKDMWQEGKELTEFAAKLFGTVENSINTLNAIKSGFAEIFEQYIPYLDSDNESLSNAIEKLKVYLETPSTVEHKEDGSIEIQLNGKTYIGTVKEQ